MQGHSTPRGQDVPYADYLPEQTWTCRVGEQPSQAKHFVDDVRAVQLLLSSLASLSHVSPTATSTPQLLSRCSRPEFLYAVGADSATT